MLQYLLKQILGIDCLPFVRFEVLCLWQVPEYPTKLFFFCEVEPANGGETPIVLSHVIYERMRDKYPDFVEKLEKHGLIYTRVLPEEDDPSSPIGRGWKSTFLTNDKSVAEPRFSFPSLVSASIDSCLLFFFLINSFTGLLS